MCQESDTDENAQAFGDASYGGPIRHCSRTTARSDDDPSRAKHTMIKLAKAVIVCCVSVEFPVGRLVSGGLPKHRPEVAHPLSTLICSLVAVVCPDLTWKICEADALTQHANRYWSMTPTGSRMGCITALLGHPWPGWCFCRATWRQVAHD